MVREQPLLQGEFVCQGYDIGRGARHCPFEGVLKKLILASRSQPASEDALRYNNQVLPDFLIAMCAFEGDHEPPCAKTIYFGICRDHVERRDEFDRVGRNTCVFCHKLKTILCNDTSRGKVTIGATASAATGATASAATGATASAATGATASAATGATAAVPPSKKQREEWKCDFCDKVFPSFKEAETHENIACEKNPSRMQT